MIIKFLGQAKFCKSSKDKINHILDHEQHMQNHMDNMAKGFEVSKLFDDYNVYKNHNNTEAFQKKLNISLSTYSLLWGGVGSFVYIYVNPWVTIIPAFFAFQTISQYLTGRLYLKKIVKSIILEKDQKQCKIELGNKEILTVNVEDNELLNVSDVIAISSNKIEEEINQKYRQNNYVIQFETKYNNKIYEDLRVLITKDSSTIPNIKLLQDIVTGEDVTGYVFQEIELETKESDLELEKRLKDELKI